MRSSPPPYTSTLPSGDSAILKASCWLPAAATANRTTSFVAARGTKRRPSPTMRPIISRPDSAVHSATRTGCVGLDQATCASVWPSSSSRASPMSRRRRFGSFSRQRCNNRRIVDGVVPGSADQSGSRSRMAAIVSATVSPANAAWPVSIAHTTQPNAQMSVRLSARLPARLFRDSRRPPVPRIRPSLVSSTASATINLRRFVALSPDRNRAPLLRHRA